MANVTQGLFGFDPTQLQQQRESALQQQAVAHASLSPAVAARASMFRAGSQLGDVGASLMGIKDPELEAQSMIQQTTKSLDLKDPVAVRGVAQQWMQSGNATLQNKALKLHEVANQAEEEANQRSKEKAAIDLAELIALTSIEYEDLAIDLGSNTQKLENIRRKLAVNCNNSPLFNTKLFAKNIESAYIKIYERYQSDIAPDHILID